VNENWEVCSPTHKYLTYRTYETFRTLNNYVKHFEDITLFG